MLGQVLVTKQTGAEGRKVQTLLISEGVIAKGDLIVITIGEPILAFPKERRTTMSRLRSLSPCWMDMISERSTSGITWSRRQMTPMT